MIEYYFGSEDKSDCLLMVLSQIELPTQYLIRAHKLTIIIKEFPFFTGLNHVAINNIYCQKYDGMTEIDYLIL